MSSMIAMFAVVATLVTNPAPISVSTLSPKERMEWRRERTREMMTALKVDEAKREAFRYERRKRILNRAAADCLRISSQSNAVVAVAIDYKSGDIRVEFADGHRIIQRYTPPPPPGTNVVRRVSKPIKPRRKEKK